METQHAHSLSLSLSPTVVIEIHPFEKAREYSRTLNAVKLDRVFAKPFVAALSGHLEGVYCMAKHSSHLSCLLSGSCDGEIRVWNLSSQRCVLSVAAAHRGFVRGLTVTPTTGMHMLSCGADGLVRYSCVCVCVLFVMVCGCGGSSWSCAHSMSMLNCVLDYGHCATMCTMATMLMHANTRMWRT
jgi:WD40 repeat protein